MPNICIPSEPTAKPMSDGMSFKAMGNGQPADDDPLQQRMADLQDEFAWRNQEMQRRLRNMLAMIRSIIRQTGEETESLDDYRAHIEGRIASYMRVQSLMLFEGDAGLDLFALVADEALLAGLSRDAIALQGESVRLSATAAGLFALLLHELVRIGASSGHQAGVPFASVSCDVDRTERRLRMEWRQRTGPDSGDGAPFHWIESALSYELNAEIDTVEQDEQVVRRYCLPMDAGLAREI